MVQAEFVSSRPREDSDSTPLYTGSPLQLLKSDIRLFFKWVTYLIYLFWPVYPWPSGHLDELSPSWPNLFSIVVHAVLVVFQLLFLLSLPTCALTFPFIGFFTYVLLFIVSNQVLCKLLINRTIPPDGLRSTEDEVSGTWAPHADEYWIFLNGVCAGKHWLQTNIDRLSRTFHRPIVGVHNETAGVIFDIIQCLIQRALLFATLDVRRCYTLVKSALYKPGINKVVLILHSQGAIEGGMILDWLLVEVPEELVCKLEIYTFGALANHFNNPYRSESTTDGPAPANGQPTGSRRTRFRMITHLEHYANEYDFATQWGVLNFIKRKPEDMLQNHFMGKVFRTPAMGHQFNQHYLNALFPLDEAGERVKALEPDDFMNLEVVVQDSRSAGADSTSCHPNTRVDVLNLTPTSLDMEGQVGYDIRAVPSNDTATGLRMHHFSRLWQYRNGKTLPS